jgi:hypothetical protein
LLQVVATATHSTGKRLLSPGFRLAIVLGKVDILAKVLKTFSRNNFTQKNPKKIQKLIQKNYYFRGFSNRTPSPLILKYLGLLKFLIFLGLRV